jgi:hypothetical protein
MPKNNQIARILVLYEEGKRVYIDVTPRIEGDTLQTVFDRMALRILTQRFGFHNKKYAIEDLRPPKPLPFTKEEFEAMDQKDEGYALAKEQYEDAVVARTNYENSLRSNAALRKCIEEQDERLACQVFEERRNLPNEGYDFEPLWDGYNV